MRSFHSSCGVPYGLSFARGSFYCLLSFQLPSCYHNMPALTHVATNRNGQEQMNVNVFTVYNCDELQAYTQYYRMMLKYIQAMKAADCPSTLT